jgi:hypothetical protein
VKTLRQRLVETAIAWEKAFGNAPSVTSALSELDAALLLGFSLEEYSFHMQGKTVVQKGHDFVYKGVRYQVKATRPSGKPGSKVTKVPKASNYDWDFLVWINYNPQYEIKEAWLWDVTSYKYEFELLKRLSPAQHQQGKRLA